MVLGGVMNCVLNFFFLDSAMNFKRILFRGHSWTLFQLDVLVFAVVDLISRNYVLAAIITFIVTWVSATD